jgi:ABC-2 type transport system ATP-binding protein
MNKTVYLNNISKYIFEKTQDVENSYIKKIKGYFFPNKNKKYILKSCNIELDSGESLAIIGSNGAGKSTLMKIISGVIEPSNGNICILNNIPYERNKHFLKKIGVVFGHKTSLLWDIPLKYSLDLHKTIYEIDNRLFDSRLKYLSDIFGLNDFLNRKVKYLSLGEKVKADLLMNMLHSPELIILDEATIGVDMESKTMIREFINHEKDQNKSTFIMTSHDPADIENCCDKINILSKGEISFSEKTSKLKETYRQKIKIIIKKTDKNINYSFIKEKISEFNIANFTEIGNNIHIIFDKSKELKTINTLIKLNIKSFEVKMMSFEEILADKFQIYKHDNSENDEQENES